MLRFVFAALIAGVLAGSALAADPNNGGQGGGAQAYSYAKNHQFLKYLGLTPEQSDKIDALFKDKGAAQQALYKDRPQSKDKDELQKYYKGVQEKVQALEAEFKVKVADVLTADQKAKYLAAEKAMDDFQKALRDANIKATNEREDALVKILGDAYKEQAEKNKQMMSREFGPGQGGSSGLTR
jgi:Spy/CpxP family protein refolding chaperone